MTDLEKCDLQYTLNKSEIFQRELTDHDVSASPLL